ncbi:MAG: S-adenosylmethionine:tRNA ribosyltransferase-isomerase [Chitinophagaceae bacterium]|nr:S-adenosylmethionine:tRNA ribosyltransferase-isomerase [Chitinophagaceae bacterium]MCB9044778.1 S-adenosylmethionine:tRNA ribosyltransferase-isomerase [Chitinophagales bacterium]
MHPKELRIEDYTYHLPDERIAKYPLEERDASKLLIYKKGQPAEDTYRNIAEHIPAKALMVFNRTKVVQARLLFTKDTGGVIEIFCLEPHEQYSDVQTAMLQTQKVQWNCLVGGASKWKHGMVLEQKHDDFILKAKITERNEGSFTIELSWGTDISFAEVLHIAGKIPLPPYLHRDAEDSDEERYQTIYARDKGSVAAPTAGLHFTDAIMGSLKEKHIHTEFVNLHVGAGTFMPVKTDTMEDHTMHAEWIGVDIGSIQHIIKHLDTGIIAVGTTTMRTLESLYWIGVQLANGGTPDFAGFAVTQWDPYEIDSIVETKEALQAIVDYLQRENLTSLVTRTQILIAPGYKNRVVDALVTNFHQPQSTLLLLVASMIGDKWKDLYQHAMQHGYRFLSYGDGCLIWP